MSWTEREKRETSSNWNVTRSVISLLEQGWGSLTLSTSVVNHSNVSLHRDSVSTLHPHSHLLIVPMSSGELILGDH